MMKGGHPIILISIAESEASIATRHTGAKAGPQEKGSTPPKRDTDVHRAVRLLRILHHIQARPNGQRLTKIELTEVCRCSAKTIQRDIKLLRVEFGVYYENASHAYVLPEGALPVLDLRLDFADILALGLTQGLIRTAGFPQRREILDALAKITQQLSPNLRRLLEQSAAALTPAHLPHDYANAPLFPLLSAVRLRQTVRMDYDSASSGRREWREVDPYAVEPRDGIAWEMHGWCHNNRAFRTFALDRLYQVKATGESYVYRVAEWESFRAGNAIGGLRGDAAQVTVDVSFAPKVARYALRRRWSETLRIAAQPDGSASLTGQIPSGSALEAMVAEVLRWRRWATVRGGPELLCAFHDELSAMTALYSE